ncbi:D-2-hydroxyacid dehydrogenase [Ruminococcaceae bacterium OttesenSCG-928-D13]|nr:D-2-hydroxyacid dehydrogenase [Ruminococcaceae bacterium OttesenSCG-928-D13]
MKIVVLDAEIANPGDLSWGGISALGELTIHKDTPYDEASVAAAIGDADAIILNKVPITAGVIDKCPNLKYIGILATGYNIIDIEAAKARGIVVSNVPGYATEAVAQHSIALLLQLTNHVAVHNKAVHAGRWADLGQWCFWEAPLSELYGKTFGCIGFGAIGQATAKVAAALGMRVIACGSRPTEAGRAIASYVTQDELLAQSHVVSLHCPLLPATAGIINRENIAKMRDGAFLLNTARGGLVVEADLAEALNSGKLAGAGVDVTATEPIPPSSPLLTAKNCIITPHIAWAAIETRTRLLGIVEENLRAFVVGSPINNVAAAH